MKSNNIQKSTNRKVCVDKIDTTDGVSIPSSQLSRDSNYKEKHLVSGEDCLVERVSPDVAGWKVDEHWTAMTAYLAEMYLPCEG